MLWTIVRTIIYVLIAAAVWLGVQFYIAQNLKAQMYNAPEKALFVDQAVLENSYHEGLYDSRFTQTQKTLLRTFSPIEQVHLGTPLFPFTTITDALLKMDETSIRMIKIGNGTYEEVLELPENTTLVGSGETTIHADPLSLKNTLTTNNNTVITNIHISGGENTVVIPYNTSALFDRVTISEANRFGVKMNKKQRPPTPEEEPEPVIYEYYDKSEEEIRQMPLVRFVNCTITKNDNQGLYLRDGRVEIINSHVVENGEEGIDLHPHMHTTIVNTKSSHNGESGLETEIYDNIVIIKNSVFDHNTKNGIALITSNGVGKIIITDSEITNNMRYGLRCAKHKTRPKKPRPFFQTVTEEMNNFYENNAEGKYASVCFSF